MTYAASSSGPFQSENGRGDVLQDIKPFTYMEKLNVLSSAETAETGLNSEKILKNKLKM